MWLGRVQEDEEIEKSRNSGAYVLYPIAVLVGRGIGVCLQVGRSTGHSRLQFDPWLLMRAHLCSWW